MKGKAFLIGLGITIFALMSLAFGIWQTAMFHSPLNLKDQNIEMPLAAKFFPNKAPLTIYLKLDTNRFPKYVEASANSKKRKVAKKEAIKIRNGLFSLIGLDYENDLEDWIDEKLSISIFENEEGEKSFGWLFALESKSSEKVFDFIENFWREKSLQGVELQSEAYKEIEINTGVKKRLNKDRQEIATAFIENNLILLGSDIETLRKGIDISQEPQNNQLNSDLVNQLKNSIDDGFGFIYASNSAMNNWFGLPKSISEEIGLEKLVASIKFEKSSFNIDSLLTLNSGNFTINSQLEDGINLINQSGGKIRDFALLSEPSKLIKNASKDPISILLEPIFKQYIDSSNPNIINSIFALEEGPLAWINESNGWLIGTNQNYQEEEIDKELIKKGYNKQSVILDESNINIWSRLKTVKLGNYKNLETDLAIMLSKEDERNWWSKNITAIQQRQKSNILTNRDKVLKGMTSRNGDYLEQQVFLSSDLAQKQLNQWQPWQLVQAAIGDSLSSNIQSLEVGVGSVPSEDSPIINLRAKVSIG